MVTAKKVVIIFFQRILMGSETLTTSTRLYSPLPQKQVGTKIKKKKLQ